MQQVEFQLQTISNYYTRIGHHISLHSVNMYLGVKNHVK
jgi:hypothetical protein